MRRYLFPLIAALAVPLLAFGQPVNSDAPLGPQDFKRGVLADKNAPVKSDAPLLGTMTAQQKAEHAKKFPRGLKGPTPREKLQSVPKFHAAGYSAATQSAFIPKAKHYWGNNQYGNCVPVASIASLAAYTTASGQPVIATDAEAIDFSRKHGWLNGTWATDVMDVMQREGVTIGGKVYKEGPYAAVDYTNNAALQTALTVGPLMIAIDADALPQSAGNKDGWYVTGNTHSTNTDHEVAPLGFGPAKWLFEQINTPLPAALKPDQQGFLVFTWSTIGFVDFNWVQGTVVECFVRNPTTVGFSPSPIPDPPQPPVPPTPPTPPVPPQPPIPFAGFTGVFVVVNGQLTQIIPGPYNPAPPPPPKVTDGEELAAAASAGYDAFAARLDRVKFCPQAIVLGFKLYADIQAKATPDVILADISAINAAVQACRAQGSMSAAPGGFPSPVMAAAGDCGQQQLGFAAGACSSAAGSCGQSAGVGACGPAPQQQRTGPIRRWLGR